MIGRGFLRLGARLWIVLLAASAAVPSALAASPAAEPGARLLVQPVVDADALFSDASAAFLAGDLPRAIGTWQALCDEGIASPELETNLGAALLRQGRRGPAALHLERALFLAPGDEDARADLAELHRGDVDRLEGEEAGGGTETLVRVLAPLPGRAAALCLVVAWSVCCLLVWLRTFAPTLAPALASGLARRIPLGPLALASLAVALLSSTVAGAAAAGRELALQRAVVVAGRAAAHEGPTPKAVSHFEVHEGTVARLDDEEAGYLRIRLPNGLSGWVESSAVERVVPRAWGGLGSR